MILHWKDTLPLIFVRITVGTLIKNIFKSIKCLHEAATLKHFLIRQMIRIRTQNETLQQVFPLNCI